MKQNEYTVSGFAGLLGCDAPAPGGGTAAVLEGALGAALTEMVCRLTAGRAKYAGHEALILDVQSQAEALRDRLLDAMEADTAAFLLVSNAFAMPKGTSEEKAARSAAIQRGLEKCTEVPLEGMELAAQALELAASILGKFNENAASDLGVASLSLRAGVQGPWLNVLINAASLKDRSFAEDALAKGRAILDRALPLADRIFGEIEASLL
mgnify:FL=1